MKYSNEFKVGLTIVLAIVIFIVGFRYFQDIPIFGSTYELRTSFDDAAGLVAGNAVRIHGVSVGRVEKVRLDPEAGGAGVVFHVNNDVEIPAGSFTRISGISALGSVQLEIVLGEAGNPAVEPGDFIPSREDAGLGALMDQAPALAQRADSVLLNMNTVLGEAEVLLQEPQGEIERTLLAIQQSSRTFDELLRTEQVHLTRTLQGAEELTANLNAFSRDVLSGENADSLSLALRNLNGTIARFNRNLAALETTTASLDTIMAKVNAGEGSLGLLVNDPSLYASLDSSARALDSTMLNLNRLILDFQQNPKRYLKDLRLVDIF